VNDYVATFFTHYGAVKFQKYCEANRTPSRPAPAPRVLSPSCGVCVFFEAASPDIAFDRDDIEACYLFEGGEYEKEFASSAE